MLPGHTIPPYWGPVFWEGALDWHADLSDGSGGIGNHRHVPGDIGVHSTDVIVRETVRIIAEHVAPLPTDDAEDASEEEEAAPLFLYLPFVAPHAPTQPAPGYTERNAHIDESLTDMEQPYKRPDVRFSIGFRLVFVGFRLISHWLLDTRRQPAPSTPAW